MTLTPATQKALDDYGAALLGGPSKLSAVQLTRDAQTEQGAMVREAELALLSVVAAEEGRKYEEGIAAKDTYILSLRDHFVKETDKLKTLVKLHREWVEARKAYLAESILPVEEDPCGDAFRSALLRENKAGHALAQWEAE